MDEMILQHGGEIDNYSRRPFVDIVIFHGHGRMPLDRRRLSVNTYSIICPWRRLDAYVVKLFSL